MTLRPRNVIEPLRPTSYVYVIMTCNVRYKDVLSVKEKLFCIRNMHRRLESLLISGTYPLLFIPRKIIKVIELAVFFRGNSFPLYFVDCQNCLSYIYIEHSLKCNYFEFA